MTDKTAPAAQAAPELILETRGLVKEFRGFVAVDGVDLKIRRGHIHALIGPNGAGKTTCFNLLTKFLQPTRGTIRFNGRDITGEAPQRIARTGMVRSFQISAVFPHMTVLENVRVALQRGLGTTFHFSMVTLALAQLMYFILLQSPFAGGENGLQGVPRGTLFGFATLTDAHWHTSGEVVLMTLLGGMGTVLGPIAGATVIVSLHSELADKVGSLVTVIMGFLFVFCVLVFRRGIVGEGIALYHRIIGEKETGQ